MPEAQPANSAPETPWQGIFIDLTLSSDDEEDARAPGGSSPAMVGDHAAGMEIGFDSLTAHWVSCFVP